MKNRLLGLCIALTLILTPTAGAFSDISDNALAQSASVLDALGIMQGVGEDRFSPNSALTRAQFCKLVVTAMGVSDASAYGSYTIFPDVKSSHWAARYINAAVRHPELKKQAIIRGYADGTFGPEKSVTYGEVCTMLLRMIGYTEADIGPFWPADYIARAKELGLTTNVNISDPKAAVTRGNAAIMLINTLGAPLKDGESGNLLSKVASATVENCILLATSETDASLAADEAIFYENGTITETPRKTSGTLDKSLIGVYGTIVIGKGENKTAIGIVPNSNKIETHTVTNVAADGITTETQTIRPNRDTMLYVAREKKADTFANIWASVQGGDTLTCYYDTHGALQFMAILPTVTASDSSSFVYGMAGSANIPNEYKIIKNGVAINRSGIKKYDVVTIDAANHQAIVSDIKISGQYTKGGPTFNHPQSVELFGGQTYTISDRAASTFSNIKLNDHITLLFSAAGNVIAAYPKRDISADMEGIVTKVDGAKATVVLTNGLTITVTTSTADAQNLLGRLVTISQQSGEQVELNVRSLNGKILGDWIIADGKLGKSAVSPNVRIYEEVFPDTALTPIKLSDLTAVSIPSNQIRYTIVDNAGTITSIILGDVTGDNWIYGLGYGSSKDNDNRVVIKYWDGEKTVSQEYRVTKLPDGLSGNPIGIPKGYKAGNEVINNAFTKKTLEEVDNVSLSAFDGANGVRTKDGFYKLANNIGVYVTARDEFISLQSAKSNYTNFRLYANKSAEEGGQICMIIAS